MSREQTLQAWQTAQRWMSARKSARVDSTAWRRITLVTVTVTGTLAIAWFSSLIPTQVEAEASFLVGSCEEGLPTTSLLDDEVIAASLQSVGWKEQSPPHLRMQFQAAASDRQQVTVVARCENPADASVLAMACAQTLVQMRFGCGSAEMNRETLRRAEEKLKQADGRYRQALADWGMDQQATSFVQRETDSPIIQTRGTQTGEQELFTAPAMLSPERLAKKNLVESALDECRSQRSRLAELYTEEHPAVIALDRQIHHLGRLSAEESAAVGTSTSSGPALVRKTSHEESSSVDAEAETLARRDMVEQLSKDRQNASAELERLRAEHQSVNPPLPEVLSPVVPGPGALRIVGSSRSALFVGCTALLLLSSVLVEILAISSQARERVRSS
jgi:hypothetical protein